MSGDVQPRKRKEKRRKRAEEEYHIQRIRRASLEDDDAGTPPPMLVNPLEQSMENVTLHIHKEGGTGGHWCARIIFFALFTVLIGLIGVIIFEYRGTTDVDTPVASSRWATVFEGWVDDVLPLHEEESHSVDEHEEDKEEDEGLGSESEDDDEENDDEDDDNDEDDDDDDDDDDDEGGNAVSQHEEEEDEDENSPEQNQVDDDEDEEEVDKSENDEGFEDDDENDEEDIGVLDEVESEESHEANGDDDEEEEEEEEADEDEDNNSAADLDISIEGIDQSSKQEDEDELDYEFVGIPGVNEIDDDSAEPLEEIEEEEPEEVIINEIAIEPLVDEITEEESTSVAVKFGVGVALVVAAHFVLVRRWNNVDADLVAYADEVPDLTRRKTIVPPGNVKQLNATGNLSQKQQQTQDLKNTYKNLQNENIINKFINPIGNQKVIKKEPDVTTASQLKKKESQEIVTSESERFSGTENESDYDYDEDELDDEEIEEEEVEDEEGVDEEEEEEEEEELDDSQLVAKLEAKYGKLPTPSQSEEEEDESEEEEEEEEEEDIDEKREEEIENWKRSNAPKTVHSGGADKSKDINKAKELSKTRQGTSAPRGGRQAADIVHSEDHNELTFQEEIENWLAGDLDN